MYSICIISMAVNMLHSGTVVPMKVLGKSITDVIMMTSGLQSQVIRYILASITCSNIIIYIIIVVNTQ